MKVKVATLHVEDGMVDVDIVETMDTVARKISWGVDVMVKWV